MLIGTSAVGLNDIKTTPVSAAMPGVEIHAQVLESALTGAVISQPNYGIALEFLAALLLGLLVIAFAPKFGPVHAGRVRRAVCDRADRHVLVFLRAAPATHRLHLSAAVDHGDLSHADLLELRPRAAAAEADSRQFAQYMSPVLVEQLAQSPEKLVLGGEEREMTIMFSDVRGFTTISETYKHDPQGLTALMNRFLTPLTNAILARKGYIDKYMGDAIMAFWNAPLDDKEHRDQRLRGGDRHAREDRRAQQGARAGS